MYHENNRASIGSAEGIGMHVKRPEMIMSQAACAGSNKQRDRAALEIAIDGIGNDLSELSATLNRLEERLAHVMKPNAPCPVGTVGANETQAVVSPAVEYLETQRRRINSLIGQVHGLMSRLDT